MPECDPSMTRRSSHKRKAPPPGCNLWRVSVSAPAKRNRLARTNRRKLRGIYQQSAVSSAEATFKLLWCKNLCSRIPNWIQLRAFQHSRLGRQRRADLWPELSGAQANMIPTGPLFVTHTCTHVWRASISSLQLRQPPRPSAPNHPELSSPLRTSAQRPERRKIRYCLGVIFFSLLRRHSTRVSVRLFLPCSSSWCTYPGNGAAAGGAEFHGRSLPLQRSLVRLTQIRRRRAVLWSRTAAMLVSKVQLLPPFIAFLFDSLQRARVPPTLFD